MKKALLIIALYVSCLSGAMAQTKVSMQVIYPDSIVKDGEATVYIKRGDAFLITDVDSVVYTNPENTGLFACCPDEGHPHAMDMGTGDGMKWACCNVGAAAPAQFGNYYEWGEVEPYDTASITNGKLINDWQGNTEYDAAAANWGQGWVTPTLTQVKNLLSVCDATFLEAGGENNPYDVAGLRLRSRTTGESIFLPAGNNKGLDLGGTVGNYWTSTPDPEESSDIKFYMTGYELTFSSATNRLETISGLRPIGQLIRPVCP